MPVIKSAKKKLRKDIKRKLANDTLRKTLAKTLKMARKKPDAKILALSMKALDKASKKNIIHKNKAARIKSKLARLSMPARKRAPGKQGKTSSK